MSAPTRGLSPAELEELGRFLASPQLQATAMSVPMLEGFLTDVVVGPRQVMPKQWLAPVWDWRDARVAPDFDDDHAERVVALVMRLFDRIDDIFLKRADAFEPIFTRRGARAVIEWCEGFPAGTRLSPDKWTEMWDECPDLAAPFTRLGTPEGRATLRDGEVMLWGKLVPPALVAIHEIWFDLRTADPEGLGKADSAYVGASVESCFRAEPKVGRNDPCPCGSGKKFKKCCGSGEQSVH